MSEDARPERRHTRQPMSYGAIIGFASLFLSSVGGLIGGIHYFDQVIYTLDSVDSRVNALGDVKAQVTLLQTRMDQFEHWLKNISEQIEAKKVGR